MSDTTLPLKDLTRQIAEHESELERLRREYDTRQARLADLHGRQEELRAQLRHVRAEIQAVSRGGSPDEAAAPVTAMPASPPQSATAAARPKLADALVDVVRAAGRPMTAKQLGEELLRRKFPTTSSNIANVIQNRLTVLVKRGVLRRAAGGPGVVLGAAADSTKPASPKATKAAPAKAAARKTAPTKEAGRPAQPGWRRGQPPLRVLLTDLLKKSRKPLAARELAEQVLATGYKTQSKDFTDVVWTALGQLEGVENVKGQGWRLKQA
jgi:hypothetical protein